MRVISQLRNTNGRDAFFVGMSIEEYHEQVKPLFDSMGEHRARDMFDVDERIESLKQFRNEKSYREEDRAWMQEVYDCSDADDLYAVIWKDLSDGFIAERVFPVAGMQMDPWERYPEIIIRKVEDLKRLNFVRYANKNVRANNKKEYFRGCLIGGAIGDALGYGVEFLHYEDIIAKYGDQGIIKYDIKPGHKALISDDTQMTLFTANGILIGRTRGIMRGIEADPYCYVHYAYKDWLTTQGYKPQDELKRCWLLNVPELYHKRAPGGTCLSALQSKEMGRLEEPLNTSKGCGAVMRIAPFGLYYGNFEAENPQMYWDQAASIGALTHGQHMSHLACAFMSSVIGRIIYDAPIGSSDLIDVVNGVISDMKVKLHGYNHKAEFLSLMSDAVQRASNNKSDVANIISLGKGWIAEEALAIAIYCACKYQDNPIKGIITAVNHGGDSDSTGSIAGNILGAWKGISSFDDYWIDNLEINDVILEVADDLSENLLGLEQYTGRWAKGRQWEMKYCNAERPNTNKLYKV